VSLLRLRAAYGESGRQPQAFAALRTFTPVQGPGGTTAITPGDIGNPDLKPERGKEWEAGFEGNLFGRVDVDFTYFSKRITDEILSQPVPPSSGFSGSRFVNLGRVDNHGIELQLTGQAWRSRQVDWDVSFNVGTNHDVIKSLGALPGGIASAGQYNRAGYPIGGIFTKRVVGATRDANGFAKDVVCYVAEDKLPVACAQAPFVFIGTPTPKAIGSVGNTVTIGQKLRLYGLVDFKRGHRVFNSIDLFRCTGLIAPPGFCEANYFPERYSPIYLAEIAGNTLAQGIYDRYWESGSFAKLRELSATYTLPATWLRGVSSASVSLAGRDLHTWTRYTGPDPEVNIVNPATSSASQDQGVTPPLRRFIATINLVF
jgi:hypothetical protein